MSTISKCMNSLSQGVYVIGSKKDETYNLMTAAWVTQVSANPNQLAVAIGASHLTAGLVREQEKFSLSVLAEGQEQAARICGTQSGRNVDKSKLVSCEVNKKGMPVVNGSAYFRIRYFYMMRRHIFLGSGWYYVLYTWQRDKG